MRIGAFLALGALVCTGSVAAQDRVALSRAVFVESMDAASMRTVERAENLRRGDRVVLVVEWTGAEARRGTVVSSPIPESLQFQRASSDELEVSVDGGRSWGQLGNLRVGRRLAAPEEVTHIRLRTFGSSSGRLTYSAIVR